MRDGINVYVPGAPLCRDAEVWIFGQTLAKHLIGEFELVFFRSTPIISESVGSVQFRTKDEKELIFRVSNVKFEFFQQLALHLGLVESSKQHIYVSRPS
jgi:hypothetical protein